MAWEQSTRESRAFDWVDYVLYILATYWFASSAILLISTGEPPAYLPLKVGAIPNLADQQNQGLYHLLVALFAIFVIFVYLRNYIVMHAIDDRKDGEHELFYFVDYNCGWWSRSERVVRALIVLWVLTTAMGTVPFVTNTIWRAIEWLVVSLVSSTAFLDLTLMQAFFAFYGFVIVVLFALFIAWDIINIASMGEQMRAKSFDGCALGREDGLDDIAGTRDVKFAIPDQYKNTVPVYCIVAYIKPRKATRGDMGRSTNGANRHDKVRQTVAAGRLITLYLSFSHKFTERVTGLAIGTLLLLIPIFGEDGTTLIFCAVLVMLGFYISVMWRYVGETLGAAFGYFVDFLRYAAPHWSAKIRAEALGNKNGSPPCGP